MQIAGLGTAGAPAIPARIGPAATDFALSLGAVGVDTAGMGAALPLVGPSTASAAAIPAALAPDADTAGPATGVEAPVSPIATGPLIPDAAPPAPATIQDGAAAPDRPPPAPGATPPVATDPDVATTPAIAAPATAQVEKSGTPRARPKPAPTAVPLLTPATQGVIAAASPQEAIAEPSPTTAATPPAAAPGRAAGRERRAVASDTVPQDGAVPGGAAIALTSIAPAAAPPPAEPAARASQDGDTPGAAPPTPSGAPFAQARDAAAPQGRDAPATVPGAAVAFQPDAARQGDHAPAEHGAATPRPITEAAASQPAAMPPPAQPRMFPLAAIPHAPVSAQPGRIGRDIGVAIARRIGMGGDEITLQLNPASLGRIAVKIAFEDGSLRATLSADNPAALDLLRRDSGDLARALDQAGIRSDSASLSFQGRGADGQPAGSRFAQPGTAAPAREDQAGDTPTTPLTQAYQPLRTSSRVDFLA